MDLLEIEEKVEVVQAIMEELAKVLEMIQAPTELTKVRTATIAVMRRRTWDSR